MATDDDELETNPFYKALQEDFLDLFETAQSKCYWICVPQSESLSHLLKINREFAETHILRPSPLFRSQFESLDRYGYMKTVTLSDRGDVLTVCSNNPKGNKLTQEDVKILSEELAYNKDFKQYRILILEKPLHPRFQVETIKASGRTKEQLEKEKKLKSLHTRKISVHECIDFLYSFHEFNKELSQLQDNITYFMRHYMILPDYLDDVSKRLEKICVLAQKSMMKTLSSVLKQDLRFTEVLAGSVESFVMSKVHTKVFPVVCKNCKQDDEVLLSKYDKLTKIKPEQIGVSKSFSCPLPSAVVELANLGSFQTPREKLYCLKATVDNVTEGVAAFIRETQPVGLAGITSYTEPCITSDDLIPILVIIIAQAKCSHLSSDLFYIEQFMWHSMDRDRDDLSYCLVTFKAAVQYMIATDFSFLKEMKNPSEKEISIEELLVKKRQQEMEALETRASVNASSKSQSDRLERQLSRISDLLEKSRLEMSTSTEGEHKIKTIFPEKVMKPTPDVIPAQDRGASNTVPLGDFLSALQNDDFDQPYGKQS